MKVLSKIKEEWRKVENIKWGAGSPKSGDRRRFYEGRTMKHGTENLELFELQNVQSKNY